MATDRMKTAAKLIAGGTDVAEAMQEAGYGLGCIPGLAPVFPDVLEAAGLGPKSRSTKATAAKAETGRTSGTKGSGKTAKTAKTTTTKADAPTSAPDTSYRSAARKACFKKLE